MGEQGTQEHETSAQDARGDGATAEHHLFLVPGFFGFLNLGNLLYFAHVREFLESTFARLGLSVRVYRVATPPTASVLDRTAALYDAVAASPAATSGQIHLVGHSSGGLDARLFTSPGAALPGTRELEPIASRVRSVITIATPHHGTPLASFFLTVFGKQVLMLMSLATVYVLRFGRLPLGLALRVGRLLVRLDDMVGIVNSIADQLFDQLLGELSDVRHGELSEFFEGTRRDQSLMGQLTPEAIELFNATAVDRPGTRYASVACSVPKPGVRTALGVGLDPYGQATHLLFQGLYRVTARGSADWHAQPAQRAALARGLGREPSAHDSDGIVPTRSQVWGEVIEALAADHLDVIGHFSDPKHEPPHYDWLCSGSRFDRPRFERLWGAVADFVAR